MSTVIVRQINPEYQETDIWRDIIEMDAVVLYGNSDYNAHGAALLELVKSAVSSSDALKALHTETGEKYEIRTLRGCAQSEWQNAYIPEKYVSPEYVETLETLYFNNGTEWAFCCDDEQINNYFTECGDELRTAINETAKYLFGDDAETEIYQWEYYTPYLAPIW